jgi:glycosyltransferase involved in cell wall biosynthesis
MFWGRWFLRDWKNLLPRPEPLRVFEPLNFYEFAAARLGFLPEPFAFSVRAFRAIARRLRAGKRYDLVHDIQSLGYGLLGIRALGLPVVTTVHHPLSVDRQTSFQRDRTLREALGTFEFYPVEMQAFVARRLERVFTSSEVSARRIQSDFGVRPERVAMLANGLDTELFSPDPALEKAPAQLLCVGRASDPNKGVRTLIAALARLPEPVTLTLVDDTASEAGRWAREAGCADRLTLTGRIDTPALVQLYRRATLVVVPSRYEGFGLPAAEAMACGTPVIASEAGALPEVVGTGGGGVLVPPDAPEALAKAIASLLEQPEARRALSARARSRVESAYAWPRVAERTAAEYRRVVSEHADARRHAAR